MNIGIMQGRLLPPIDNRVQGFPAERWREEFPRAVEAGLQCIEWLYSASSTDMALIDTDNGIHEIQALSQACQIQVPSICAMYFIEKPLLRASDEDLDTRKTILFNLIRKGEQLGVNRIVVPFLDASRIDSETEMEGVAQLLTQALVIADETSVELHIETSIPPQAVAKLLRKLPHPKLKITYDIGNSASLGYKPSEEFSAYGERIGSVHIKDRVLNGGTVPLGTGDADFSSCFCALNDFGYSGDFILEAARDVSGDEVAWTRRNRTFIEQRWSIFA